MSERSTTPAAASVVLSPSPAECPAAPSPAPRRSAVPTAAGVDWLAAADPDPGRLLELWTRQPHRHRELPCGVEFDVVSAPGVFGRRLLEQLWRGGPGSGPVVAHRGRLLLLAAPGTAARLPTLLRWEEWNRGARIPPLLCHGGGDVVTLPSPSGTGPAAGAQWLVAPVARHPWLPGAEVLLWGSVRACRSGRPAAHRGRGCPTRTTGRGVDQAGGKTAGEPGGETDFHRARQGC